MSEVQAVQAPETVVAEAPQAPETPTDRGAYIDSLLAESDGATHQPGELPEENVESAPQEAAPPPEEPAPPKRNIGENVRKHSQAVLRKLAADQAREKAERAEFERKSLAENEELRSKVSKFEQLKQLMGDDPTEALKELGFELRDLNDRSILKGTPEEQIRKLSERLSASEARMEERAREIAREMVQQSEQNALTSKTTEVYLDYIRPETTPALSAFYGGNNEALIQMGIALNEQEKERTGKFLHPVELAKRVNDQAFDGFIELLERSGLAERLRRAEAQAPKQVKKPAQSATASTPTPSQLAAQADTGGVKYEELSREDKIKYLLGDL